MSTNSIIAGILFLDFASLTRRSIRGSGTITIPRLGSMVQKGKFAEAAFPFDKPLNNIDLPTLGNPTSPHFKAMDQCIKSKTLI
ncbi:Putative uncharacterized protein [Cardinium endosymbiont cEper1 of Encarsia pergandiella]|nr:Putative uncharacterized protein [Cardinium endosymbiont cEper1 of Encarsia pergandiella]